MSDDHLRDGDEKEALLESILRRIAILELDLGGREVEIGRAHV